MTPSRTRIFVLFFGIPNPKPNPNPNPNPNHYNWIMCGEHTSTAKTDHEATEEHDRLIITGTMSEETTSNRKRKQENTDQHDHQLENVREKLDVKEQKKHLTNVISGLKKLKKKLNVKEKKKQLKNVIGGWKKLRKECKKKLHGREKHPWKLIVGDLQMLLHSEQPGSICQLKI